MSEQRTFASLAWQPKGKVTRREQFLVEMGAGIPWARLLALIEPHYPQAGNGRQPLGLEKMLRIYFLQQWFNLSDPQAEDAIYDSESLRRFARGEPGSADISQLPALLHGQEREIFGDQAYWKEADRLAFAARGVRYRVNRRRTQRPLSERWRLINRERSRTRACGEHAFRVIKQLWGFTKVRYRGLAKNLARTHTMFALLNLNQLRRRLLAPEAAAGFENHNTHPRPAPT